VAENYGWPKTPYASLFTALLVPGKKYPETGIRFLYGKTPAII